MRPEYEIINGIKYAIIWRKKGYDKTNKCPFCNTEHIHGSLEGHRIPHCSDVNVRKRISRAKNALSRVMEGDEVERTS